MTEQLRPRVAVILAGSGAKDGSEITEAVSLMINLSLENIAFDMFAPARSQSDVINHLTGEKTSESRNMLKEAARIARGNIKPLSDLKPSNYQAIAFSGGFGTAKNLCNYASEGSRATLEGDVKAILDPFLKQKKPVAALCIAPIIVALACKELGIKGAKLTLGDGSAKSAVSDLESFGATHVSCPRQDSILDEQNRIISAPAYMYDDATQADIFLCSQSLVRNLKRLLL